MNEFSEMPHDMPHDGFVPGEEPREATYDVGDDPMPDSGITPLESHDEPGEYTCMAPDLPTAENPIGVDGLRDIGPVVSAIAGAILHRKVHESIQNGYELPPADRIAPNRGHGEHKGTPPAERTPGTLLRVIAADRHLATLDQRLAAVPDLIGKPSGARTEMYELTRYITGAVLARYGVNLEAVTYTDEGTTAWFPYKDNAVRVSTLQGVTQVNAWDRRLGSKERDKVWEEHDKLEKVAAPVAHMQYYLDSGNVPSAMQHMHADMVRDRGIIHDTATQSYADLRAHAVAHGYRVFQVFSSQLRFALPIAMHILERPTGSIYPLIGEKSATGGYVGVAQPGRFTGMRANADKEWGITANGMIKRIR